MHHILVLKSAGEGARVKVGALGLEIRVFGLTFLTGVLLSLVFDMYRALRAMFRPGRILTGFADLLFWVAGTGLVFAVLLYSNQGEMRLHVILAVAAGIALYHGLAGKRVVRFFLSLFRFGRRLLAALAFPVRWSATVVGRVAAGVGRRLVGHGLGRGG